MQLVVSWSNTDPDAPPPDEVGIVLWLPLDGTNGSTTIVDESPTESVVYVWGNAALSTAQSKFGGASAYFDGTGDLFQIPHNGEQVMGSSDFTITCWIRPDNVSAGNYNIITKRGTTAEYAPFLLRREGNILSLKVSENGTSWKDQQTGGTLSANTWHHVALVRNGQYVKVYLDGSPVLTCTLTAATSYLCDTSRPTLIGGDYTANWFIGYIDDLVWELGARYTEAFTPPIAAYSETPIALTYDPLYDQVAVLLHMEGVDGVSKFQDHSRYGRTVNSSANTVTSVTQFKFGTTSYHTNGASSGLSVADADSLEPGAEDFTIEFWAYFSDVTTQQCLVTKRSAGGYGPFHIDVSGGNLRFLASTNGTSWGIQDLTAGTPSLNTWHHIALVRYNGNLKLYLDGVETGTAAVSGTLIANSQVLSLCSEVDNSLDFSGYMDEFRYTVGVGRYTGTFTPPTAAFPHVKGAYTGWTPADGTTPYVWYNAEDPRNTRDGSDNVTRLEDLSGNGRHATSFAGYKILFDGVVSNRKGLSSGNSSSSAIAIPSSAGMLNAASGFAAAASVWRTDYHANAQVLFFSETPTRNTSRANLSIEGATDDTPRIVSRRDDGDSASVADASATVLQTGTAIVVGGVDLANRTAVVRANGTPNSTGTFGTVGSSYSATDSWGVCYFGNSNAASKVEGFVGSIGEILAYNVPLSVSEMEKLEGYLAWRWEMLGRLPSTHPYKLVPPSV